jgi:hypothetical protein
MIRETTDLPDNQKKLFRITPEGELVLSVYSVRMKKRGIASTPALHDSLDGKNRAGLKER